MTAPLLAHATDYGRMYARSTSAQFSVPSITTVIGQQPHGLDGWFGYMGANSLAQDLELAGILGSPAKLRQDDLLGGPFHHWRPDDALSCRAQTRSSCA